MRPALLAIALLLPSAAFAQTADDTAAPVVTPFRGASLFVTSREQTITSSFNGFFADRLRLGGRVTVPLNTTTGIGRFADLDGFPSTFDATLTFGYDNSQSRSRADLGDQIAGLARDPDAGLQQLACDARNQPTCSPSDVAAWRAANPDQARAVDQRYEQMLAQIRAVEQRIQRLATARRFSFAFGGKFTYSLGEAVTTYSSASATMSDDIRPWQVGGSLYGTLYFGRNFTFQLQGGVMARRRPETTDIQRCRMLDAPPGTMNVTQTSCETLHILQGEPTTQVTGNIRAAGIAMFDRQLGDVQPGLQAQLVANNLNSPRASFDVDLRLLFQPVVTGSTSPSPRFGFGVLVSFALATGGGSWSSGDVRDFAPFAFVGVDQ